MLVAALAAVWAIAGSALVASPALAGGFDDEGNYNAAVYNLTPYPWTLVEENAPSNPGSACLPSTTCWDTRPYLTIEPGKAGGWGLRPNFSQTCILGGVEYGYDGWMTYRVDVLGGPPEYVTIALSQELQRGTCGSAIPTLRQFITREPPPTDYDPGPNADAPPGPVIADPQLTFQAFHPYDWDLTYSVNGDYTVDARSDLGRGLVDVLNALCDGASNTTCSFTQTGPFEWGLGHAGDPQQSANCAAPGSENDYTAVDYEVAQSASLSVGGGVSVSTEVNLFNTISSEATLSVEAEHEWEEVRSYSRESKVFIPPRDIASIWVIPVVGTVTGTLVVSNGSATFTVKNFSEQRSGVAKDPLTPAFDVITKLRPMTVTELESRCHIKPTARRSRARAGRRRASGAPSLRRPAGSVRRSHIRPGAQRPIHTQKGV
jgi:hypothetical protein